MRESLLPLLLVLFVFTTGAAIIDKETKSSVLNLDQKVSRLEEKMQQFSGEQKSAFAEMMQVLKEEIRKNVSPKIVTVPATVSPIAEEQLAQWTQKLAEMGAKQDSSQMALLQLVREIQQSLKAILTSNVPDGRIPLLAEQDTKQHAETLQLLNQLVQKIEALPKYTPPKTTAQVLIPEEMKVRLQHAESYGLLSFFLGMASLVLILAMFVFHRRSTEKILKTLHPSEPELALEDIVPGRPHLRLEVNLNEIHVINKGEVPASDIKLSLGASPSVMKQKVKTAAKMKKGELSKIAIPTQLLWEEILYVNLEYKCQETGHTYKEQFVFKLTPEADRPVALAQMP